MNLHLKNTLLIGHILFFLLAGWFVALSIRIQGNLNEFPAHIHAWTQSDRYAIAEGFVENGGNLFLPRTRNLKPNFEGTVQHPQGITSVDFPLPEYLSSIFMKVAGNQDPIWCRIVQVIFGILGLYALFRIGFSSSGMLFSLMPLLLLLSSPSFMYYMVGFIPSIPAISLVLIGLMFFYVRKNETAGILIATLGAMIRTPLIIMVVAMIIQWFYGNPKKKGFSLGLIFSFILYLSWFIWSKYLKYNFGSIFLGKIMPVESLDELLYFINSSLDKWWDHIFSNWAILPFLLFLAMILYVRAFGKLMRNTYFRIGLISLTGGIIYALLMIKQFENHDYYFLDAFLLPILLLSIGISAVFKEVVSTRYLGFIIAGFICILIPIQSISLNDILQKRRETGPWDRYAITIKNFKGADKLLDSLSIPRSEPIVIIDSYSTNAPLLLSKRYGYTIQTTSPEELKKVFKLPVKYAIIQHDYLRSDVIINAPDYLNRFKRIGGNRYLSVYKLENIKQTEEEFAGVSGHKILFQGTEQNWINMEQASDSMLIVDQKEYGPTFRLKLSPKIPVVIWMNTIIKTAEQESGIEMIFKRKSPQGDITRSYALNDYGKNHTHFNFKAMIPMDAVAGGGDIEFFLYNPQSVKVYMKKPDFRIYQY